MCLQRAYGGLFFGQQLQSRHHGEAGVIIADSQYAAVLLGDGSHLQKAEAVAAGILPALGFAMLGKILISPKVAPYFLLGFLLAAYLNVPVLGIALLGVIIVALMLVNDQNKPNNTAVVDGGADDDF